MNTLTNADVYVKNQLFATLDTRTRKMNLNSRLNILISDTVGFVRNLPHQLVASFKATLEEALNADLLLHLVDVSSPEALEQLKSAEAVLQEIGCDKTPTMIILNKADITNNTAQLETLQTLYPDCLAISAKTGLNLDILSERLEKLCKGKQSAFRIRSHLSNGKVQSFLRANGKILKESYIDSSVIIDVELGKNHLAQLNKLKPDTIEPLDSNTD